MKGEPKDYVEIQSIVSKVEYLDYRFKLDTFVSHAQCNAPPLYIQVQFDDVCTKTNKAEVQKGRKYHVSRYATESEIVQTCLLAALQATEHEVREKFKYEDKTVFHPHFDVHGFADLVDKGCVDVR